uniref:hypothetical protein n=1 Tax=Rheinheimera sp. TaxID=1869214 RepID=UPI00404801DA
MKVSLIMCSVAMLLLAGCSSTAEKQSGVALAQTNVEQASVSEGEAKAEKDNMICYHEKTIGSNRKSLRCMSKEDRDKMREVSRDAMLRQQRGSETGGG